jgi:hypothetical protein
MRLQQQQGNRFVQRYLAEQAKAAPPLSPDPASSILTISQAGCGVFVVFARHHFPFKIS